MRLHRFLLRCFPVLALLPVLALSAFADPPVPPRPPHISASGGYLNSDFGSGFAASPSPGHVASGSPILTVGDDAGAWQVTAIADYRCTPHSLVGNNCPFSGPAAWQNGSLAGDQMGQLQLTSAPSLCYAVDTSFRIVAAPCDYDQAALIWVIHGFYFINVWATDNTSFGNISLLSEPGAGQQLLACGLNCQSVGHQSWNFGNTSFRFRPRPHAAIL